MRGVKASIEDRIANQEERVSKAKNAYETELSKLKELKAEQEEEKRAELLKAVEASDKSIDDVMKFLQS